MINGYSTLGAVALRLAEDNMRGGLKSTRYTLEQAVEKVCWQKKSIAAEGDAWSYVWWWFDISEECMIHYDPGLLPCYVKLPNRRDNSQRYVPLTSGEFDPEHLISDWIAEWTPRGDRFTSAMLCAGLQPYQRCLSRYSEEWHTDYMGESDSDHHAELLYVEPYNYGSVYLPVPVHGWIAPTHMVGLTVSE